MIKPGSNQSPPNPNFYAIIPANVRYDNNLTPIEKLLYVEITALTNDKGYCWAGNEYFAKLFGYASKTHVSKLLNNIENAGHINIEIKKNEGNKRFITLVNPILKNQKTYSEKSEHNKYNIKEKEYTSEMKADIEKAYDIWLKFMVVPPEIRRHGTTDERHAAIKAARIHTRLTDKRKAHFANRIKSMGIERVLGAIVQISKSEFHRDGIKSDGTKGTFTADIEWLCKNDDRVEKWANKGGAE